MGHVHIQECTTLEVQDLDRKEGVPCGEGRRQEARKQGLLLLLLLLLLLSGEEMQRQREKGVVAMCGETPLAGRQGAHATPCHGKERRAGSSPVERRHNQN